MPSSAVANHSSRLLLLLLLFALILLTLQALRKRRVGKICREQRTTAPPAGTEPLESLAPSPTSEQKTEETE
jgi:hypothetical protein